MLQRINLFVFLFLSLFCVRLSVQASTPTVVSQQDLEVLVNELHYESIDDRRLNSVQQYVHFWQDQSRKISMEQAQSILSEFSLDGKKMEALLSVRSILNVDFNKRKLITRSFSFIDGRRKAWKLLFDNELKN